GFSLAFAQGLLGALPVIDINQEVEPAKDLPLPIPQRNATDVEPAIDAVSAAMAALDIVRRALSVRIQLRADRPAEVVRVGDVGGLPALQLLECLAEVGEGSLIETFDLACRRCHRDRNRNAVDDQLKIELAPSKNLLSLLKLLDIRAYAAPFDDPSGVVPH